MLQLSLDPTLVEGVAEDIDEFEVILLARIEPLKDFSHEPNVDPREFYVELRRRVTEDEAAPAGP